MKKDDPMQLVDVLKDPGFQLGLGRILAADALSGNADRAMATKPVGKNQVPHGWFNEGNILIDQVRGGFGKYAAVAIDNAFNPWLSPSTKPFGLVGAAGSLAAASPAKFQTEAGLIFDRLVQEIQKAHPTDPQVQAQLANLMAYKAVFVSEVGRTAQLVMDKTIGNRHQHWKRQLAEQGASEEQITEFSLRKRYMRLLRLGCEPDKAQAIARDERQYRLFILRTEKGMSRVKAWLVLKRGPRAYKRAVRH
jgi:hypothetical protein